MDRRTNRFLKGGALLESLMSMLILVVGIMGSMAMVAVVHSFVQRTDHTGIATSLARRAVEEKRAAGFYGAAEGASTVYYDANGANGSNVTFNGATFQVVSTTTSSSFSFNNSGNRVPSPEALRTVDVRVYRTSDGAEVTRAATYLSRGGI